MALCKGERGVTEYTSPRRSLDRLYEGSPMRNGQVSLFFSSLFGGDRRAWTCVHIRIISRQRERKNAASKKKSGKKEKSKFPRLLLNEGSSSSGGGGGGGDYKTHV